MLHVFNCFRGAKLALSTLHAAVGGKRQVENREGKVKICLFLFFSVFNKLFYGKRNADANRKKRRKRPCPKCKADCRRYSRPFPAEKRMKQKTAPDWRINKRGHNQKQNKCLYIPAFMPNPFAETEKFVF